jgi:hypothetical protein
MKLKKLFHALVLAGTALGVMHCGGGTSNTPGSNSTGGQTLPDGGVADGGTGTGGMPGGPGGW